jgi:putative heme-binding domain-containing protein
LESDNVQLLNTSFSIISRRPEWSDALLTTLRSWLNTPDLSTDRKQLLITALLNNCRDSGIQKLIAESLEQPTTTLETRLMLLETIQRSSLDVLPPSWLARLGQALASNNSRIQRQAINVLRHLQVDALDEPLRKIAFNSAVATDVRVDALLAVAGRLDSLNPELFAFLSHQFVEENAPLLQLAAARALSDSPLTDEQLMQLSSELRRATPTTLPVLLEAFSRSKNARVGMALIASLKDSPAVGGLSANDLIAVLKNYGEDVQTAANPLAKRLNIDVDQQTARLQQLSGFLSGGDRQRGHDVFFGNHATCSSCHTISGQGGKVGPDLTGIGSTRSSRDLLEAIVFPSASFARGFRPYSVVTTEGVTHMGLISRRTEDAIYLQKSPLEEIRIPNSMIEEINESSISIMPLGLERNLSDEELRDLLAFLITSVSR